MVISPLINNKIYGHQEAKQLFLDSFQNKRLHHSWLITGEKGIGKATLTYHFAKFLLQHPLYQPNDLEISTRNSVVKKIEGLTHPDLIIIDAEIKDGEPRKQPTITIEEVRGVIQFLRLTASESKYKVVVIDGADYMNISASNAMLKILEEPPKNTIIFLIASSAFKILPTIRSRCLNLKLKPLSFEDFKTALEQNLENISPQEAEELYNITSGNLKLAVEIHSEYGIKFLKELEHSLNCNSINDILKFVENIKTGQENWSLVKFMLLKSIINKIKLSLNDSNLEDRLNYFFELQKKLIEVETFHLDKQHFILSTLS